MIPWNPKFLYFCIPLIWVSKYITWRFGRKFRCSNFDLDNIRKVVMPGMILLSRREFKHLCDGKIIRPADLYENHHAWEIVFQKN